MKLRIVHETLYTYRKAVGLGQHRLVLRPREGHDLHVDSMQLEIKPSFELRWSLDVFGNSIATVDFMEPSDHLRIVSDVMISRTERFPRALGKNRSAMRWPAVYDPLEIVVAEAYQRFAYPEDRSAVQEWLKQFPVGDEVTTIVRNLNRLIYKTIKYTRREEKGVLTPAQTLRAGAGSCRDLATLLLEAARSLGIAARFASGYLDCAASEAGRASTHAWAEIYLPGEGWRGFDPTLGEEISDKHVVTGVSSHPRGVMPVSGFFYGAAEEFEALKVSVLLQAVPATHESGRPIEAGMLASSEE
jgi:transglutaminase-like putative cysteine protease